MGRVLGDAGGGGGGGAGAVAARVRGKLRLRLGLLISGTIRRHTQVCGLQGLVCPTFAASVEADEEEQVAVGTLLDTNTTHAERMSREETIGLGFIQSRYQSTLCHGVEHHLARLTAKYGAWFSTEPY